MTETKCGAMKWPLICDREVGHDGEHRGYNGAIDEPMFWPAAPQRPTMKERVAEMPGYLNGYDQTTEADQHHAYIVGFADAVRQATHPDPSSSVDATARVIELEQERRLPTGSHGCESSDAALEEPHRQQEAGTEPTTSVGWS